MNDIFKFRAYGFNKMEYDIQNDADFYFYFDINSDYIPMQCTGLKDKNSTLIYEGDIIKGAFDDGTLTVIRWSKKDLTWCADFSQVYGKAEYSYYVALADYDSKNLEVIGNIYENPELFSVRNEE